MIEEFDVIVLGGGPAGENAAQYAVEGTSRTAAIVEQELLGGECSYYACMPSKALLRPLDVAAAAAHLGGLSAPVLDRDALLARRDSWVSHYSDAGQQRWADGAGLAIIRGHGRLSGERRVSVDGEQPRELVARQAVVLATGSVALVPELYADVLPWSNRDATGVVEIPRRLLIVGGGVVACEAARWMTALGSQVTVLNRSRLLGRVEPFAGELVADGLQAIGVELRLGARVIEVNRPDARDTGLGRPHGGAVTVRLDGGEVLEADEILLATGRVPATAGIGLESVGLTAEDLRGRTGGAPLPDWLFTVGDVNSVAPLTHWGKYQARLVGAELAARAASTTVPPAPPVVPVPQVIFTDPQVAAVGLTEEAARAAGHQVTVSEVPYSAAAGAGLLRDDLVGRAKLVMDAGGDRLLGATFVGPDVAEIVHAATVAITGQVPVSTLRHAVASYPSASEIWLRLLP